LTQFFAQESEAVFYQRQLQVIFEDKYFHWITVRALTELVQEGKIVTDTLPLLPDSEATSGFITFYRSNTHRYWKREADEIVKLVYRFSDSAFTSALGAQGETMFDAALPTGGFMPLGRKVRSHRGMEWKETKHDLVQVFGIATTLHFEVRTEKLHQSDSRGRRLHVDFQVSTLPVRSESVCGRGSNKVETSYGLSG
jgi:hypothetical protein